jgi:hypothetical protein
MMVRARPASDGVERARSSAGSSLSSGPTDVVMWVPLAAHRFVIVVNPISQRLVRVELSLPGERIDRSRGLSIG